MRFILLFFFSLMIASPVLAASSFACNRWKCKTIDGAQKCIISMHNLKEELVKAHPNCTKSFIQNVCSMRGRIYVKNPFHTAGRDYDLEDLCQEVGASPTQQQIKDQAILLAQKQQELARSESELAAKRQAIEEARRRVVQSESITREEEHDVEERVTSRMAERNWEEGNKPSEENGYEALPDVTIDLNEIVGRLKGEVSVEGMQYGGYSTLYEKLRRAKVVEFTNMIDVMPRGVRGRQPDVSEKTIKSSLDLKSSKSFKLFKELLRVCPYVQTIKISNAVVSRAIQENYQTLEKAWQGYIRRFLKELMRTQKLSDLKALDLSGNNLGNDPEVPHIFTHKEVKVKNLHALRLFANGLSDETVAAILSSNSLNALTSLSVEHESFDELSLKALNASIFKNNLIRLSLNQSMRGLVSKEGPIPFPRLPKLKVLVLFGNGKLTRDRLPPFPPDAKIVY